LFFMTFITSLFQPPASKPRNSYTKLRLISKIIT
jgi:hypothetical protein